MRVVPRTGYVDRNSALEILLLKLVRSYPARGTWIEMNLEERTLLKKLVVPRTGYVDRNIVGSALYLIGGMSYPARGTWIEMIL